MSDRDRVEEWLDGGAEDTDELVPSVDIPEPPDGDGEVDPDVISLFWRLVVVFNLALLVGSLGIMFLVFLGDVETGGRLLAVGILAGTYGLGRYWLFKRERLDGSNEEP